MSNILFLPPYYSETLGKFKYDVSGLFNFTSTNVYIGYKILRMEHNSKKYYFILIRWGQMLQF